MAIDSRRERAAGVSVGNVAMPVSVQPTGSIMAADRQVIAWGWPGILVSVVVPPTVPGVEFTVPAQRMHFTMPVGRMHFTIRDEP